MPSDSSAVLTTIPIYRSTYVLAYLTDKHYDFKSLDDPRLKELKIGTYQHSAIRILLASYGIKNLQSLAVITPDADLRPENQPWRQVQKLVDGQLDVVGVWGPFAGWVKKGRRADHAAARQPHGRRCAARVQSVDRRAEHRRRPEVRSRQGADRQEGRDRQDPRRFRRAAGPVQRLRRRRRYPLARRLRQGRGEEIRGALSQVGDGAAGDQGRIRGSNRLAEAAARSGWPRAPTSTPSSPTPSSPSTPSA